MAKHNQWPLFEDQKRFGKLLVFDTQTNVWELLLLRTVYYYSFNYCVESGQNRFSVRFQLFEWVHCRPIYSHCFRFHKLCHTFCDATVHIQIHSESVGQFLYLCWIEVYINIVYKNQYILCRKYVLVFIYNNCNVYTGKSVNGYWLIMCHTFWSPYWNWAFQRRTTNIIGSLI